MVAAIDHFEELPLLLSTPPRLCKVVVQAVAEVKPWFRNLALESGASSTIGDGPASGSGASGSADAGASPGPVITPVVIPSIESWYFPCKSRYDETNGTLAGRVGANELIARRARCEEPDDSAPMALDFHAADGPRRVPTELEVRPDMAVEGTDHPETPEGAPGAGQGEIPAGSERCPEPSSSADRPGNRQRLLLS